MNISSVLVDKQRFQRVLCCYQNVTPRIQIVRVFDDAILCLERVIFPAEQFLFEAFPESDLEINHQDSSGILLQERTPCSKLQVKH